MAVLLCACLTVGSDTPSDALFQAIRNNDLSFLKAELTKGASVDTRDKRGSTLLMHAAAFGSVEAVKLLLDAGADVNAKNSVDASALIWGAAEAAKARMLIEKGADVNAKSKLGRTPLLVASATAFRVPAGINFEHLLLELARCDSTPFQIHPWRLVILNNGRDLSHLPLFPKFAGTLGDGQVTKVYGLREHMFSRFARACGRRVSHWCGRIRYTFLRNSRLHSAALAKC